jgi:hypothetical protein
MTAAARPATVDADLNRPPTVPELLRERSSLTDQVAQLERDLCSLRVRNRALINARNEMAPSMNVVGTFPKRQTVERIIGAAQTCEELGAVPAIRFVRNLAQEIIGIELAVLTDEVRLIDDGFRVLVALGGMAVSAGDPS